MISQSCFRTTPEPAPRFGNTSELESDWLALVGGVWENFGCRCWVRNSSSSPPTGWRWWAESSGRKQQHLLVPTGLQKRRRPKTESEPRRRFQRRSEAGDDLPILLQNSPPGGGENDAFGNTSEVREHVRVGVRLAGVGRRGLGKILSWMISQSCFRTTLNPVSERLGRFGNARTSWSPTGWR